MLGGWPVQFLPPGDALGEEALAEAVATEVDNVATRVMTAEHLVALALQLGRAKDHARILQFIESGSLSIPKLEAILLRHGMQEKWRKHTWPPPRRGGRQRAERNRIDRSRGRRGRSRFHPIAR